MIVGRLILVPIRLLSSECAVSHIPVRPVSGLGVVNPKYQVFFVPMTLLPRHILTSLCSFHEDLRTEALGGRRYERQHEYGGEA